MATVKFIHAADLHLDSPLLGLERYGGVPVEEVRAATRRAMENMVELALNENVDFVLIAGDLYDGDWKDYNTGLFFAHQMSRLNEAGIKVFIIAGNHDAASQITKRLRLPENAKLLSSKKPESELLNDIGVAIHGQGFISRAVKDNLAINYPGKIEGYFNIGLLHTALTGREGHEPYAPCSVSDLQSKDYDYWALGHVHEREIVSQDPWIVFPGNPQGRHAREEGAKGCTMVTLEDLKVLSVEHRELDVMRWVVRQVDAGDAISGDEVLDRIESNLEELLSKCEGDPLALRLVVEGCCKAHKELSANPDRWKNEARSIATHCSGGAAWIEKVDIRTSDAIVREESVTLGEAVRGLRESIAAYEVSDATQQAIVDDLQGFLRRLPPELKSGDDPVDLDDPEVLRRYVDGAKGILQGRLSAGGELI